MSAAEPQHAAPARAAWWLCVLAIAAAGASVRLREVTSLHLVLDERLVLRAVERGSPLEALWSHGGGNAATGALGANVSPIVTFTARLLHRMGALDEWTLRLPMLVCGVALLALPLAFTRRLGRATTLVYAALVASSAPLIYFSFVARPYALALLAVGAAFAAWDHASRTGSRAGRALFGVASGLAVFFHAFAAPVVAAPFLVDAVAALRGRLARRAWWIEAAVAVAVAALLLGPGATSFGAVHGGKIGLGRWEAALPFEILSRLTGSLGGTSALLCLAIVGGLVHWGRRDARFGTAGALALALPALALALVRPLGGAEDWARYAALAWPVALLFAASGIARAVERAGRALDHRRARIAVAVWAAAALAWLLVGPEPAGGAGAWLRGVVAPVFSWGAAALVASGALAHGLGRRAGVLAAAALVLIGTFALSPIRLLRQAPDGFRSHPRALAPLPPLPEVPAFYARLAADADAGPAVLECPDPGNLIHSVPYDAYQRVHGRRVLLLSPVPEGVRRGFRNLLDVDELKAARERGARYAIVHRDLGVELGWGPGALSRFDPLTTACRRALRRAAGPPVVTDPRLEVYDLRVMGAGARPGRR